MRVEDLKAVLDATVAAGRGRAASNGAELAGTKAAAPTAERLAAVFSSDIAKHNEFRDRQAARALLLKDLKNEQVQCLRDFNRRAEAHGMLDDLRDRCGYDVEALRATLPPRGRFREIVEMYSNASEIHTGGGCMAVYIPCSDGTHLLLTDTDGMRIPGDDDSVVLVGRYNEDGWVDIAPDLRAGEHGAVEVSVDDLERVIDSALGIPAERDGLHSQDVGR